MLEYFLHEQLATLPSVDRLGPADVVEGSDSAGDVLHVAAAGLVIFLLLPPSST